MTRSKKLTDHQIMELLMATVARLEAAIAQVKAMAIDNTDLKNQIATLQAQVANMPDPAVMAKADELVDTVLGPAPAPDATQAP